MGSPSSDYRDRTAAAIAGLDEQSLDDVYDEALSLHSIESVTRHVVMPLLERLGVRWEEIDGAIPLGVDLEDGVRLLATTLPSEEHAT